VAAVAELKGPDCGNATKENDKDPKVEKNLLMKILLNKIIWTLSYYSDQ
jgi:hypothetical protein